MRGATWCAFGTVALVLASAPVAGAQLASPPAARPESVTIAAGTRYQAGALHRWFVGNLYRDLWVTPIRVPLLDWQTYAGGLQPTKAGGGQQSKSLRFEAADGREFVFRLSDKLVLSAPAALENTPAMGVLQDATSAMHPAAAQISAPIVEASGSLHPTAVLMVLPDDPALGKYRDDFAGRLGMLEEYPSVPEDGIGFGGATKIIDSADLLELLTRDATQHIDARAFLTARLTDFLINDNDRHPGNWKWARLAPGPTSAWVPIGRDRDHAFVSYGGRLSRLLRLGKPSLVVFGDVPSAAGLTRPEGFDARLLAGLGKVVWDSVTGALQTRISDSVIDAAAHATPVEYQGSAPALITVLGKRRAAMTTAAQAFYRLLAAHVEVHGTDSTDRAVITREAEGFVAVRLESAGQVYFSRRFDARETSEILVYLHGGDDMAIVTGRARESILVRVIGGNGTNTFIDSSTVRGNRRPTRFYDAGATHGVSYGPDTLFDRRPWERKNGALVPHERDVGTGVRPVVGVSYGRSVGVTPRFGLVRYRYGFNQRPYASMVKVEGEYALRVRGARVGIFADRRLESSPIHFTAMGRMSSIEVVNFFGIGNATIDSGTTSSYFDVHQRQWMVHPAIARAVGSWTDIAVGPVLQHSTTDRSRSRYLSASQPYGSGTFNQAGLQFGARFAWRDANPNDEHTHHQVRVELNGLYYLRTLDVRSPFEVVAISLGSSTTLPIPTHPLLVMRGGAKKVYGDAPYFEAAFIGGEGTTRYMDTQRFAGDASVYGTSELRIPVARFRLMVPWRVGIVGIAEAGRVYADGASPGGWHTRTGEGIWLGCCALSSTLTVTRTTEPGRPGIHIRLGLNF